MTAEQIQQRIATAIPGAEVRVASADGVHFEALVISADFAGQRTLQRHRAVYAALGESVGREIHALALSTFTPEEWAARP